MAEEPTTPDLVELVREAVESTNPRDLDAVMSFYAPDARWEAVALGASLEGAAAIRGFLEDWMGAYDEWELEPEELLDLGHGVAFVVFLQKGRPVGSSADVRNRFAQFVTWSDGLIVNVTGYTDIDEARAAAERFAEERG